MNLGDEHGIRFDPPMMSKSDELIFYVQQSQYTEDYKEPLIELLKALHAAGYKGSHYNGRGMLVVMLQLPDQQ